MTAKGTSAAAHTPGHTTPKPKVTEGSIIQHGAQYKRDRSYYRSYQMHRVSNRRVNFPRWCMVRARALVAQLVPGVRRNSKVSRMFDGAHSYRHSYRMLSMPYQPEEEVNPPNSSSNSFSFLQTSPNPTKPLPDLSPYSFSARILPHE
jgi:hypothetical protein